MLTLYELKQNKCFRCCYKAPYYIKNLFLMGVLALLLFIIYVIYFRADGGHYQNVLNILKGLNSNTFNYLETNRDALGLDPEIQHYTLGGEGAEVLTTQQFVSSCVRLNRPCVLDQMATDWPAMYSWRSDNGGAEYLSSALGDEQVSVFVRSGSRSPTIASRAYSFRSQDRKEMTYKEFLAKQQQQPQQVSLMESAPSVVDKLRGDIRIPGFYDNIADVDSIVLYQGSHFVDKPHYDKEEQIICVVDGAVAMVLVPHVNRQEVYSGEVEGSVFHDPALSRQEQANVAPVNFFIPNKEKYRHFDGAIKYPVQLEAGSCVFVPAFFFYHMQGFQKSTLTAAFPGVFSALNEESSAQAEKESYGSTVATVVGLKFQGNSELLAGFYEAIENKVIQ